MENGNGLFVVICVTKASGKAEVQAAQDLIQEQIHQGVEPDSVGADKGYCTNGFVQALRERRIRPHVAKIESRRVEGLDGRTLGSPAYRLSQRLRERVEEGFGWPHMIAGTKKVKVRGREKVEMAFVLAGCALNLMRIAKLAPPGDAFARP